MTQLDTFYRRKESHWMPYFRQKTQFRGEIHRKASNTVLIAKSAYVVEPIDSIQSTYAKSGSGSSLLNTYSFSTETAIWELCASSTPCIQTIWPCHSTTGHSARAVPVTLSRSRTSLILRGPLE